MVFSGIPFLYYFLPLVMIIYLIIPGRFKNLSLLAASLFFYWWGEQRLVLMLILGIIIGFVFGILIEKAESKILKKLFLTLLIVINIALLAYFKYIDFFIVNINRLISGEITPLNIALPIGISFYTFQILSYGVDVYRGDVKADRNPIDFGAYVSFFPQLIAGPIVRYQDIAKDLKGREHSLEKISYGIRRFAFGIGKKVIFANAFGSLCVTFRQSGETDVLFYWLYAVSFMLQIYYDFSGYSDMAIGLGSVFGFHIRENFDYPYTSKSITEFWRRWHMSLGSWFRDYVYIPLGGSRCGILRQAFNIAVVWSLTGFWHGASWNFIIWGAGYAVLLALEKFLIKDGLKNVPVVGHIYVIFFVMMGFVLFNANDLGEALSDFAGLFGAGGALTSTASLYYLRSNAVLLVLAIFGATPFFKDAVKYTCLNERGNKLINVAEPIVTAVIIIVSTAFLVAGSFNPFLYFRF